MAKIPRYKLPRVAESTTAELVLSVCTGALLLAKAGLLDGLEATTHHDDAQIVAKVSTGLGPAMPGLEVATLDQKMADRGW